MTEKPMTLLIVDDHQEFRGNVKHLLAMNQTVSVVGEAGDGEEAVHLVRTLQPDLVLMDISMPRLNGLEATRQIKTVRPETKIIILTLHGEDLYRKTAGESGADFFLCKHEVTDKLIPTIQDIERNL